MAIFQPCREKIALCLRRTYVTLWRVRTRSSTCAHHAAIVPQAPPSTWGGGRGGVYGLDAPCGCAGRRRGDAGGSRRDAPGGAGRLREDARGDGTPRNAVRAPLRRSDQVVVRVLGGSCRRDRDARGRAALAPDTHSPLKEPLNPIQSLS